MDPVLAEIYSTVLGAAPFVIAAYALILVLCGYVVFITTKLKRTEKKLAAIEEHVDALK